jgi:hypothetical protein
MELALNAMAFRPVPISNARRLRAVLRWIMDLLPKIFVVVLLVGALVWALQPRYAFVVRIERGTLRVTRGKVALKVLQQLEQACSEADISRGWVGGIQRGRRVTLAFSRSIPPPCRQRLRNLWVLHG